MKKWIASTVIMVYCLFSSLAYAMVTADGQVYALNETDIVAPFSGVVLPLNIEVGDSLKLGDEIVKFDTNKTYASCDGTLAIAFAKEGDQASDIIARYGALALVEPEHLFMVEATTKDAHDNPENKVIHVGEKVYYESKTEDRITGQGRIIAVEGQNYRVEITAGTLEVDEEIDLYRDVLRVKESKIGAGICTLAPSVKVMSEGRIIKANFKEGETVKAGDLLFETLHADAKPDAQSSLFAQDGGVITKLNVGSGQQVYKGQHIATIADMSELEIRCMVDEVDLSKIKMGASLKVVLDAHPNEFYYGEVSKIALVGKEIQNASYYEVSLKLQSADQVKLGMNATVYLDEVENNHVVK